MALRSHRRYSAAPSLARSLALALFAREARAQEVTTPDATRARDLYFSGVQAFEAGRNAEALRLLTESNRLRPVAAVEITLGQVHRAMGDVREAVRAYQRYLVVGGATLSATRRQEVSNTIAELDRTAARLRVSSDPDGASMQVDGREVGRTPTRELLLLTPGAHEIEVQLPGYVSVRERIEFAPRDRRDVHLRLADTRQAATLRVSLARPSSAARVRLDGIELGAAPIVRQVSPGGHRVEADAPGMEPFRAEIVLGPRQDRSLRVRLEAPPPLAARPWFWGVVAVVTAGVAVGVGFAVRQGTVETPNGGTIMLPAGM